jgi:hypothetical protein
MIQRIIVAVSSSLILAGLVCFPAIPQIQKQMDAHETMAQVPVLDDFHEVIFKLWHTAWPAKDIAMLSETYPEIKHYVDSLARVELPGILRDRQASWKENVAKLQSISTDYEHAVSTTDSVKLLNAAEQLHAQYEKLVRITRPVLKEMDRFHQVLYMIYHHYLPEKNQAQLEIAVKDLKEKMAELNNVALPERMKKRESAFKDARTRLAGSVEAIDVGKAATSPEAFAGSIETMHTDYQALEKVFE